MLRDEKRITRNSPCICMYLSRRDEISQAKMVRRRRNKKKDMQLTFLCPALLLLRYQQPSSSPIPQHLNLIIPSIPNVPFFDHLPCRGRHRPNFPPTPHLRFTRFAVRLGNKQKRAIGSVGVWRWVVRLFGVLRGEGDISTKVFCVRHWGRDVGGTWGCCTWCLD